MPKPTPFHDRTFNLCTSYDWMLWGGKYAVRRYDTTHQGEYFALRFAAGLIDVTPLFKYYVKGPDAARYLSWAMTRDLTGLEVGRAAYSCWCDDDGKILDDGPVFRIEEDLYMVTAGEPALAWLSRLASGFDLDLTDRTDQIAGLAVQGPTSRGLLQGLTNFDLGRLRYYGCAKAELAGAPVLISRTGYSGDLGYEVWMENQQALTVWDAIWDQGQSHGLLPVGQDALDVARIEAGLILNGVDFTAANLCLAPHQKSTPYEMGLGRIVQLDREVFVGREALMEEREKGPREVLVGLELDWDDQEAAYEKFGLPAAVCVESWKGAPVFGRAGRQVGKITSGAWSPILKKSLALAVVNPNVSAPGSVIKVDYTVEHQRHRVKAEVVKLPFYNPERKTDL